MATEVTYTDARANLAALWDRVVKNRETVIIHRRGAEDVALVSADELGSLLETAYLLRSPRNARRLLEALEEARRGEGTPQSVESIRKEFGLDAE